MATGAPDSKRVLVGERDPGLRELYRIALRGEGYEVDDCADGPSLVAQCAIFQPAFLVVDSDLPPTGGIHVMEYLRSKGSVVPVILLFSTTPSDELRLACQTLKPVELLAMPFGILELLVALNRAAAHNPG
jgi:DNA-binding response OmpR family regulator